MNKLTLRRSWRVVLLVLVFALGAICQRVGMLDQLFSYREDVAYLLVQHIELVVWSGSIAIAIGVPLGILLSRPRFARVAESAMQGLNIGTTIPTLALLALSMSVLGIGTVPSVFGLCIASLLPIVRNTYAGLREVPEHLKEAASGMGMTPNQMLLRVELPNAMYVIFAGIRTALAINVGTVPLVFLIGGGGLGDLIFTGIALNEPYMMLAGAIPTALLAIVVDILLAAVALFAIPKGVNPLRMGNESGGATGQSA